MRHGIRRWSADPSTAGMWVALVVLALLALIALWVKDAVAEEPPGSTQAQLASQAQVEAWIKHFLRGVKKGKRWKGAQELSALIVQHAADPGTMPEKYWEDGKKVTKLVELNPVDPMLVAVNFSLESSFYQAIKGGVGELGLPQIHPQNLRGLTRSDGTRFDMEQRAEQVEAGVRWLAYCVTRCDGLEQAITAYKTGPCKPIHGGVKVRLKRYRKARKLVGLSPAI